MNNSVKKRLNPRKVFWQRGTCSHAMFHLLNHEFNNPKPQEEKAADMLAGGIAQKGHQCGMLWGAALAAGAEAFRRYDDKNKAMAAAINASKLLVDSFQNKTNTVNCRDITGVDWENRFHLIAYTIKTLGRGLVYSHCFNLLVKWTPEAIRTANTGLLETPNFKSPCFSCATEVVKKMGGTEEESIMVGGFAGGIGLSGNACGALGSAIWYSMLQNGRNNQAKPKSSFNNPGVKKLMEAVSLQTNSEMLCRNISKTTFNSIDEHADYITSGGCEKLIDALADS
jgi:C_GCAxxG_C_C family probable redox protein